MKPRARANQIEPITDPLGKHWQQPKTSDIVMDDKFAYMSENTFKKLLNYSGSQPSGVYPGKMWRCYASGEDIHTLCWFSTDPVNPLRFCKNNYRQIVIMEKVGA